MVGRSPPIILGRSPPIILASFLVFTWLIYPLATYTKGTSEGVTVELIAEPFVESNELVYRWKGELVRSCHIELRRYIIDSENVVTRLTPKTFSKLPVGQLGQVSYEVSVKVPVQIAEGPATYQVVEVPRCNWIQHLFPRGIMYPPVNFTVTRIK